MTDQTALIGYVLAAVSFLVLSGLLLTRWSGRVQGIVLPIATVVSVAWALVLSRAASKALVSPTDVLLAEIAFNGVWIILVMQILASAAATRRLRFMRYASLVLLFGTAVAGLVDRDGNHLGEVLAAPAYATIWGFLLISLAGLVGIEQIYRNARTSQQNALKYLCLGVATVFAYNLLLYSNAIILGQINDTLWSARGFVVTLSVPLLGIAASRSPLWPRGVFVSRQIVFYSTALIGAGLYFTVIAFTSYYIGVAGGSWGSVAQLVFFCGAGLVFLILVLSDQTRAKVRVFLNKNFLENKYDYRDEWLRLIDTLTDQKDGLPLKKRAIKALAQIIDSGDGLLWLRQEDNSTFECVSGWNRRVLDLNLPVSDPLVEFLDRTSWVIDLGEYNVKPSRYAGLSMDELTKSHINSEIVVPLKHEQDLFGFIALSRPRIPYALDFEDRDLLKTIGQQIASYLAQEHSTERLAEIRQFEAFNKLTAFIMHDLKNALAQQSLVVKNAELHKRNPKFVDDAIETIKGSITRLGRVLQHLQQRKTESITQYVELASLLRLAIDHCRDRYPVPEAILDEKEAWVSADQDRLLTAIQHAIQNAQDATANDGRVTVQLEITGSDCAVVISDTGKGMDEAFIRERLFRPFDSTKGSEGMGIGAYQIKETLRAIGGDVSVQSAPGRGTELRLRIPMRRRSGSDT
jgi:putative PEP-CTERM system histidine kinase